MTAPLSPAMRAALELAEDVGRLQRYPGGCWAEPNARLDGAGAPLEHVGASAVLALIAHGRLRVVAGVGSKPQAVEPST